MNNLTAPLVMAPKTHCNKTEYFP